MNDSAIVKIKGIIAELEDSVAYPGHKSTKEVIRILLQGEGTVSEPSSNFPYPFEMDELEYWRVACNERQEIHYWRAIYSHRRIIGRFIVFFKRVVRKVLKFLLLPMVEEANQFHQATAATFNVLSNAEITTQAYMYETLKRVEYLEAEVRALKMAGQDQSPDRKEQLQA